MILNAEITTKTSVISITKEGLLKLRFLDNDLEIDLEEARAQISSAEKLAHGKALLVLVDARDSIHELTPEATKFIANYPNKKGEAILVRELHQRIVATFYLKLTTSRYKHPARIFKNEEEAIEWLLALKN